MPQRTLFRLAFKSDLLRRVVHRRVVDHAAKMLAPERQQFSSDKKEIDALFAAKPVAIAAKPIALYVHIPFCASACRYCIFKKTLNVSRMEQYIKCVLKEIEIVANQGSISGRPVTAMHIGGGTPSLLDARQIDALLTRIESRFGFKKNAQITLEGNPDSLTPKKVAEYCSAGVNRISMGVQSLNDDVLHQMGRNHTGDDARTAISALLTGGLENLSVDLMYGFKGQSTETFINDVQYLMDAKVAHISAFPLIRKSIRLQSPAHRKQEISNRRKMYQALVAVTQNTSYQQYSSEDFATTPDSKNKYQMAAWQFPKQDVVTLGAGSLGSLGGVYYSNCSDVDAYMKKTSESTLPVARIAPVSKAEEMRRSVLLGAKYIHIKSQDFFDVWGVDPQKALRPLLSRFEKAGIWTIDDTGVHVTHDGLQIITDIWSELILSNLADAAQHN